MAVVQSPTQTQTTTNDPIRVQVVARAYWPVADESTQRLMATLDAWKTIGVQPSVLTTRWNHAWPDQITLRCVRVERILPAPTSSWNESHLQKNITKWLIKNNDSFDAVYVDAADTLLSAIVSKSASIGKPILCRFNPNPCRLPKSRSFGTYLPSSVSIRDALRKCHAIITEHRRGQEALVDLGCSKEQSIWIPDAVFEPARRSETDRKMACQALFDVSGDLALPAKTHLVVHFGETTMSQVQVVLESICDLLDRGIPIRMWIINPGPDTSKIYEWLKLQGWHHEILIFDGFDVLDDLIGLADLVIASNPACSLQHSTRLAIESQVSLIAAFDPTIAGWMPETPLMKWYHSRESLGTQLSDWLAHRSQWEAEAMALRRHYQVNHPNQQWLDRWISIFKAAVSQSPSLSSETRFT